MHQKFKMCLEDNYESAVIESLYGKLTSLDKHQFKNIEEKLLEYKKESYYV